MVVKVDLPPRGQEGMSQLSVYPVEAGMQRRPPAVCVIKRVETCAGTDHADHQQVCGFFLSLMHCWKSAWL